MADLASVTDEVRRATRVNELELIRSITSGFATFGMAVRDSALSDAQKSRVLAGLADASRSMMDATNAFLFELSTGRAPAPAATIPAAAPAVLAQPPAMPATTAAG